jgi:hypothetical protein
VSKPTEEGIPCCIVSNRIPRNSSGLPSCDMDPSFGLFGMKRVIPANLCNFSRALRSDFWVRVKRFERRFVSSAGREGVSSSKEVGSV